MSRSGQKHTSSQISETKLQLRRTRSRTVTLTEQTIFQNALRLIAAQTTMYTLRLYTVTGHRDPPETPPAILLSIMPPCTGGTVVAFELGRGVELRTDVERAVAILIQLVKGREEIRGGGHLCGRADSGDHAVASGLALPPAPPDDRQSKLKLHRLGLQCCRNS